MILIYQLTGEGSDESSMKKLRKTLSGLLLLAVGVLLFYGNAVPAKARQASEDEIRQTAAMLLSQCMQMDEEDLETLHDMREVELDYALVQARIPSSGSEYLSILDAWNANEEECGAYAGTTDMQQLVDSFEITERNYEISLSGEMEFENYKADVTLTFDEDGTAKALTIGVQYGASEIARKALMNTLIGMGTVFAVLILMCLLISSFSLINKVQTKLEEKKKQKAAAEVPVEFTTEEEIDEDVLYVIVAAVCSDLRNNPL